MRGTAHRREKRNPLVGCPLTADALLRATGTLLRAPGQQKDRRASRRLYRGSKRPDPRGDGTGLRFKTEEHGGDYPDNMPQAITVTDAHGRWAVYVPLRVNRKIVDSAPVGRPDVHGRMLARELGIGKAWVWVIKRLADRVSRAAGLHP